MFSTRGHFYSPLPSIKEVKQRAQYIFDRSYRQLPGIDLNEAEQFQMLENLSQYYHQFPYIQADAKDLRYTFKNDFFGNNDSYSLYSMIRYVAPKRIIEIGSGFSSAVTMDTNELFFNNSIQCTFIEPYPDRLHSIMRTSDQANQIIDRNLQEVDLQLFDELDSGDILFIDSSHVAKVNSDVNTIFFNILPRLKQGVYIHIHDIFFPFEYPEDWIYEGRAWNEAYMLRTFLAFNQTFKIKLWNHFLMSLFTDKYDSMPICKLNGGGSIWLEKVL